jgi:hypothetical protein
MISCDDERFYIFANTNINLILSVKAPFLQDIYEINICGQLDGKRGRHVALCRHFLTCITSH